MENFKGPKGIPGIIYWRLSLYRSHITSMQPAEVPTRCRLALMYNCGSTNCTAALSETDQLHFLRVFLVLKQSPKDEVLWYYT